MVDPDLALSITTTNTPLSREEVKIKLRKDFSFYLEVALEGGITHKEITKIIDTELARLAINKHGSKTKAALAVGVNRGTFTKWSKHVELTENIKSVEE